MSQKDNQWPPLDVKDIKPKKGDIQQNAPLKHNPFAEALKKANLVK